MKAETESKIRELSRLFAENVTVIANGKLFDQSAEEAEIMQKNSERGYELEAQLAKEINIEPGCIETCNDVLKYAQINGSDAADEMAALMPFYFKIMEEVKKANPDGGCPLPVVWQDAIEAARIEYGLLSPEA